MNRKTILGILALSAGLLHAENRSFDEAQSIAREFLGQKAGQPVEFHSMRRAARNGAQSDASTQSFYAFNDVANDAFVVVSGTTLTRPVLAYGAGQLPTDIDDSLPEGLRWWLEAISRRTAYLEQHPEAAETEAQIKATTEAVAPLLGGIAWNQTGAYALQTPTIGNQHCPTGCVATAMGQIFRYYRQPTVGQGEHSYTWKYRASGTNYSKELSVNFAEQTYDYSLMPLTFDRNYQGTSAEQNEVSKLLYHCGVAVNMDYDAEGSGATSPFLDRAFVDYFGFNSRTICIMREAYSYDQWIAIMQGELREGRPVLYTGRSYIEENSGHAFVLEGFDSDGRYYVNWGWNGNYNAYYDIAVLNPDGVGVGAMRMDDGFCEDQNAVVNISPNEGVGTYRTTLYFPASGTFSSSKSSATKGSSVNITVRSIYNYSSRKTEGDCGIVLMQQGNVIERKNIKSISLQGVKEDGSISGINLSASYTIPSSLSDGSYQAYLYFEPKNSDDWDFIQMSRTTYESYLQLDVSGNNVSISRPKVNRDIEASQWSFDTQTVATRTEQITARVTNRSNETINGEFLLQLTSPSKTSNRISESNGCHTIAPGESAEIIFTYRFLEAGQWNSTLYFRPWNVNVTTEQAIDEKRTFDVEADMQGGATFILHDALYITSSDNDGRIYRNSAVTATLKPSNHGSDYEGTFAIWFYSKTSNPTTLTPLAKYECPAAVPGDGETHTITLDFRLDFNDLNKNVSYYARPYYFNGTEWQILDPNIYAKVNIYGQDDPSAGIEAITIDAPTPDLRSAQIFNILGKPISLPASGSLLPGLYIINGRKTIIK